MIKCESVTLLSLFHHSRRIAENMYRQHFAQNSFIRINVLLKAIKTNYFHNFLPKDLVCCLNSTKIYAICNQYAKFLLILAFSPLSGSLYILLTVCHPSSLFLSSALICVLALGSGWRCVGSVSCSSFINHQQWA